MWGDVDGSNLGFALRSRKNPGGGSIKERKIEAGLWSTCWITTMELYERHDISTSSSVSSDMSDRILIIMCGFIGLITWFFFQ